MKYPSVDDMIHEHFSRQVHAVEQQMAVETPNVYPAKTDSPGTTSPEDSGNKQETRRTSRGIHLLQTAAALLVLFGCIGMNYAKTSPAFDRMSIQFEGIQQSSQAKEIHIPINAFLEAYRETGAKK